MGWFLQAIAIARGMSPKMREGLKKALDGMEEAAKETKSPVDDTVVGFLKGVAMLLGII